jgi:hypothetical protein
MLSVCLHAHQLQLLPQPPRIPFTPATNRQPPGIGRKADGGGKDSDPARPISKANVVSPIRSAPRLARTPKTVKHPA